MGASQVGENFFSTWEKEVRKDTGGIINEMGLKMYTGLLPDERGFQAKHNGRPNT